jgi:hypothetical protein
MVSKLLTLDKPERCASCAVALPSGTPAWLDTRWGTARCPACERSNGFASRVADMQRRLDDEWGERRITGVARLLNDVIGAH